MKRGEDTRCQGRTRQRGERIALVGLALCWLPGFSVVAPALIELFFDTPDTSTGILDSYSIRLITSPVTIFWGMMNLLGVALALWALLSARLRVPWFYYAMQLTCVVMLTWVWGIIPAILLSRYIHYRKREFLQETPTPPGAAASDLTGPRLPRAPEPSLSIPVPDLNPGREDLAQENARLRRIIAAQVIEIDRLKESAPEHSGRL